MYVLGIISLYHNFFFNLCACVHVKGVFIMIFKKTISSFFLVRCRCKENVLHEFLFHSFFVLFVKSWMKDCFIFGLFYGRRCALSMCI
jgi:hypothetical protein